MHKFETLTVQRRAGRTGEGCDYKHQSFIALGREESKLNVA